MTANSTRIYGFNTIDTVAATCWCESHTVGIPKSWVGTRTRSCGRPDCRDRRQSEWTPEGERVAS